VIRVVSPGEWAFHFLPWKGNTIMLLVTTEGVKTSFICRKNLEDAEIREDLWEIQLEEMRNPLLQASMIGSGPVRMDLSKPLTLRLTPKSLDSDQSSSGVETRTSTTK
jgi:hypothetical protein